VLCSRRRALLGAWYSDGADGRERYASLNAHVSSRAFPSALLRLPDGAETSAEKVEESYPVLLPGLDLLNRKL
jgi:hypothetical protein